MPDDRISLRQLLALLFAALLAPAIGVLPSQTAALAGEAGGCPPWLPCRYCWGCAGCSLPSCARQEGRAGPGHRDRPGQGLGKGYFFSIYCGVCFCSAPTPGFSPSVSCPPVTGTPPGSVFADPAGAHPLAGAQAGAGAGTDRRGVLPGPGHRPGLLPPPGRTPGGAPAHPSPVDGGSSGVLSAAVPVLGLFGYVVFAAFLGECHPGEGDRRRALWWAAAFCLVLTALQLVCLGNFGPGLTARMDTPFL
ncbi:hypothetical protein M5E87_06695 [Flavonifractor plautii]|nr:hypothetical protein M5E87_06695 [Flavonifractor plautii]